MDKKEKNEVCKKGDDGDEHTIRHDVIYFLHRLSFFTLYPRIRSYC